MTIRQIAQRCGVSRGTVDRVINGRGKVHPETEALILKALQEVGYTKNIAGRALGVRKTAPVLGALLSSEGNPFFGPVIEGIRKAEAELTDYGVTTPIVTMRGYRPEEQLARIKEMEEGLSALVLHPINDARIVRKVAELADRGIPTVTVNSDLEGSVRRCYVGSDYEAGGRTAAGVVRLATGGAGRLGILTGVKTVLGHGQRLHGFESRLSECCPEIRILARASAQDDIEQAAQATAHMLAANPTLDTLMVIAAGLEGVCRAVFDAGREDTIRIFAFDNIPSTRAMMERGLVRAVVCQQPAMQGYQAVKAAYDIILQGAPGAERYIMENQVKVLENLDE